MTFGNAISTARFPEYEVPPGGVERMHSSNVRGLSGLELIY